MHKICVIGSMNMDLCVEAPRMPAMGETVLGRGFIASPGGKGANQAVAAARLGAQVTMVGCVGDDAFGARLIGNLRVNGVDTGYIRVTGEAPTGAAVILLHEGDNCIVVDPGANMRLRPGDIEEMEGVIAASDMLILQLEVPPETVRRAMELARAHGVRVLLNPAPAQEAPAEFLAMADVLTPNASECEALTGCADMEKGARALVQMGIPRVVVTLGGRGVLYNDDGRMIHRPARPVNVVDTTAAGDAFTGALAVSLAEGMGFEEAVDFAQAAAALTVTRRGAQEALPGRAEAEGFM